MWAKKAFIGILSMIVVLLIGCNAKAETDIGEMLTKTEQHFEESEQVASTASSFNGDDNLIKFRLMVDGYPTEEEAEKLFQDVLDTLVDSAGNPDLWKEYHGSFDIKNYQDGVIYQASKQMDEELHIKKAN